MNKEQLITRRAEVEKRFNETKIQYEELGKELIRLQGSYRELTDMIESEDEEQ